MDGTGRLSSAAREGSNVIPKMKDPWWACAVAVKISARVEDDGDEEEGGGSRYAMKTFESILLNVWTACLLSRRVMGGKEDLRTWDVILVLC